MRFTKPAWVAHKDPADKKKASIFSVHVHPDGTRIATGGLDAKVRIWSTAPILNPHLDDSNPQAKEGQTPPKALCTLSMHAGPVLTVRWANHGRWLASGSDDMVVMVWDWDPQGGGKVWGSDDVNVEGWKALKRLPGHESDVTDLAFSPDDRYLASVGLDSKVLIWSGATLELIRKLDQHQGYVKGVCWDPVGQYLATQSDDKSVKIWNTTDWTLEATITKPFEDSPGSTFFRRLSWSPDGAHITASNAMNNNGYVFVAAVISRSSWSSNISLVGHENTVEVSAYNPHLFKRDTNGEIVTSNICSVVALGSDDLSISVWQTKSARPLIVVKDVFERPIMDLAWSRDGLDLYACSSDGSICTLSFDVSELEGIAPLEVQADYLKLFNFIPPPIAQSYAATPQPVIEAPTIRARTPPPSPPRSQTTGFNSNSQSRRPDGKPKRRIKPVFISHLSSSFTSSANPGLISSASDSAIAPVSGSSQLRQSTMAMDLDEIQSMGSSSNIFAPPIQTSGSTPTYQRSDPLLTSGPSSSRNPSENGWESFEGDKTTNKRRFPSIGGEDDASIAISRASKARTLGGDRKRDAVGPVREIRPAVLPLIPVTSEVRSGSSAGVGAYRLPIPALKNVLVAKGDDKTQDVFEGRNSEDGSAPSEVTLSSGTGPNAVQFLDYVSSGITNVTMSNVFCAAALEDGSLNVYSPTGRRLMPTMMLDSPCMILEATKSSLMAITASARLYVWDIKRQEALFPPVLIHPLFSSSSLSISMTSLRPNGSVIVLLSNVTAWSYNASLATWVKLSEARWGQGSDVWEGPSRNKNAARGPIASLEQSVSEMSIDGDMPVVSLHGPSSSNLQWWNAALTLGHLESRMHAAKILDSAPEFKANLQLYAKRIADEGFRGKAEELLKELCGPLYWKPSREETWTPTVLGMQKRELLRDVMGIFAKSRTLAKLGQDWQEKMKKAQNEE